MSEEERPSGIALHHQILFGFVFGVIAGLAANETVDAGLVSESALRGFVANVTEPIGQVFLNLLFFVVVPIVFSSIVVGVARLDDVHELGRLSRKTLIYFVGTSLMSALLGLALVTAIRPGVGFDPEAQRALSEAFGREAAATTAQAEAESFWPDVVVGIVSRNPLRDAVELKMLPVIFSALIVGVALAMISRPKANPVIELLEAVSDTMIVIVGFAMRLAPVAVFALIFGVIALFGWDIVRQVFLFVLTVILGYLIHLFIGYGLLIRWLARLDPWFFFRQTIPVMITAVSTSSSSATLPTTMRVCEKELHIDPRIAGFVLPLGATTNMNGTSMFVTIVVVFLSQVFGVSMGAGSVVVVLLLAVMTAIGAAGVPSGSLPIIVAVLASFGIPGESIAIVIGVDRILDMGRTVVNVTGDATAACYLASSEGLLNRQMWDDTAKSG